jgi:hypothetical protein
MGLSGSDIVKILLGMDGWMGQRLAADFLIYSNHLAPFGGVHGARMWGGAFD